MKKEDSFLMSRGYLPVVALVVVCFVMVGLFTTENSELWLDGTQQSGLNSETTVVEEDKTSAPLPETTMTIEEKEAAEGILDPYEPVAEPEPSPLEALPVIEPQDEKPDDEALEVSLFSKKLLAPAEGEWVREFGFGFDETYGDYRFHNGRDMQLALGDMVYACENGTVIQAEENAEWGGIVALEGKNMTIYYYGVVPSSVAVGDEIAAGELLGTVAAPFAKELAQGSHLHLVIIKNGEPQDPAEFFEK